MIQFLTKNLAVKLIALVLAVGLWYYAVGEEDVEFTRAIPLEISVVNPQMSILKTSAHSIEVTFAAPRSLLSELASEDIRAIHEIGDEVKTAGDYSFRIEASEIDLKRLQPRIVKIEPDTVQVTLDELIAKKLKIKPVFSGEPAFGYIVVESELQLDPNAILVEGPKSQLEKDEFIETEPIDLVGRIRSFRRTVRMNLPPNVKALSETLIDTYVPIREEFEEKSFSNVPVKVLQGADEVMQFEMKPANISFILKGSKRRLEALSQDKILAYVAAVGLKKGEHDLPVQLVLPEEVSLNEEQAITVKLIIS